MSYSENYEDEYYKRIKSLNIKHYTGEIPYYSVAKLRAVERKLLNNLEKGSSILDLGCGSGRFSIAAGKLGYEVTGVDITPKAIETASNQAKNLRLENVTFLIGDMTDLDIESSKYDYVICPRFSINAVATFSRRKKAVREMLRVVKPGGCVFIESFNRFYLGIGIGVLLRNIATDIIKGLNFVLLKKILNKGYRGLLPGDMIYPSNKVEGASKGYAHIPTIFELIKTIPKHKAFQIYSIPELLKVKKFDPFKLFRYSIWIEIYK